MADAKKTTAKAAPTKVEPKAEPKKAEPKPQSINKVLAALGVDLEKAIQNAGEDRERQALLRVQSAIDALPDATGTNERLERP